ncbi:MAG: hypothetical protein WDW38_006707 [Sanguina aurantia]
MLSLPPRCFQRTEVLDQQSDIQEQLQEAGVSSRAAADAAAVEEPAIRNQLSLYAHISQITWNLSQPDVTAGAVSDAGSGDIRPFRLDSRQVSQFELVNQLWALI